jgi:hypothetical protein
MANSNFIIQNGLTVGPLTIFAGNGDIYTSGNVNSTGVGNTTIINTTITNEVAGNLLVGSALTFSATGANIQYGGNQNSYFQLNMQNASTGGSASSDYVATANNGSDNDTFIDMGINGSGYAPTFPFSYSFPNDGYIYVQGNTTTKGGNLMLAVQNSANTAVNSIYLAVGGQNSANIVANITNTGILPGANLTYNLGSGGTSGMWWNNIYGTSTHALYADLAENYLADKTYTAGTVLMFGGTAEVTMADADTTRVAGVVSTNPAHLMNGGLQGAGVTPLALMGRVPCLVVGPVAKGDLLVSAGWGYAKVNNNASVGQVIGKALEDFTAQAKGMIEVVVGRV